MIYKLSNVKCLKKDSTPLTFNYEKNNLQVINNIRCIEYE